MLNSLTLYDLFILSFVQLVIATVLVLSPARSFDTHFQWTGSRLTENILGALGAAAVAAVSCFLTVQLWGLSASGVEAAALLLVIFSLVVIVVRPDCTVVGKLFYASFAAAGFTFLGYAAVVAANSTRSIAETLTASFLILLDLGAFLVWNSNINYTSDAMCRTHRSRGAPPGRSQLPAVRVDPHPRLQRAARVADRDDQGSRVDRLPELRDRRDGQQHGGPCDLGSRRGVLPRTASG